MRPQHFRRDGTPYANVIEWAMDFEKTEDRIIGRTELPNGLVVSTVWLGINYNFTDSGPPIIFETMVFGLPTSEYVERYATEEEARVGHKLAVAKFQNWKTGDAVEEGR